MISREGMCDNGIGENAHVEILECHPVVGIRPLEESFEDSEVLPRHQAASGGVGDAEKDAKLRATDFA